MAEDNPTPTSIPTSNSTSTSPNPLPSQHPSPELEDYLANIVARNLVEMSHSDAPPLVLDTLEISDALCDVDGLKCKYTSLSTNKHFHSPPSKCVLDASPSDPSLPPHEHCISHLCPLPGEVGRCLLLEKYPGHICCHWNHKDRESWEAVLEEMTKEKETGKEGSDLSNGGKLRERYRYGDGAVEDRSGFIRFRLPEPNFYMGEHIVELGKAGKDFLEEGLTELEKDAVGILINLGE